MEPSSADLAAQCCEVVITGPDEQWMLDFTRRLVEDGLAAAGHNLAPMRTIYRWQGVVEDAIETRLILHTRRSLVAAIAQRTREEHPFEVACVAATPMIDGSPEYLSWILDQTQDR